MQVQILFTSLFKGQLSLKNAKMLLFRTKTQDSAIARIKYFIAYSTFLLTLDVALLLSYGLLLV